MCLGVRVGFGFLKNWSWIQSRLETVYVDPIQVAWFHFILQSKAADCWSGVHHFIGHALKHVLLLSDCSPSWYKMFQFQQGLKWLSSEIILWFGLWIMQSLHLQPAHTIIVTDTISNKYWTCNICYLISCRFEEMSNDHIQYRTRLYQHQGLAPMGWIARSNFPSQYYVPVTTNASCFKFITNVKTTLPIEIYLLC